MRGGKKPPFLKVISDPHVPAKGRFINMQVQSLLSKISNFILKRFYFYNIFSKSRLRKVLLPKTTIMSSGIFIFPLGIYKKLNN